ncbi:UNVERIFIED_CONTAM: hypothetical protein Scaly_1603800 [Sesamum calycinum]|uniref:Uncharacterized protein n=1 Tax=Sesamum calycinum TaxID=2727403 RepID=A0AAW2PBY5_9LAMI
MQPGRVIFVSSHEGVPDDGMRSCPMDTGPSSYCYRGSGLYDYDESGLADCFSNVVHAVDQPLWMKDDVDFKYCKFFGDAKYKPSRGRDPHWKKSPYAVLRYLSMTPCLQRLYSLRVTAEHIMRHATHQIEEGSMCHPSDGKAWKHFDRMYPDFAEEPRNIRLDLCTDGFAPHVVACDCHTAIRSDRDCHTAINNAVKGNYLHPRANISQIPQEHQLFWFQKLKVSYWWDYDDDSMFKVIKSQIGKFLRKRSANARNQLARPLGLPRRSSASF